MPARPYPGSVRSEAALRAGDGLARGRGVSGRPGGTWTYAATVYVIEFVSACTKYAGHRASFSIQDLKIIEGGLPRRAVSLVLEWAFQRRDDLMANWERAQRKEALAHIEPLE